MERLVVPSRSHFAIYRDNANLRCLRSRCRFCTFETREPLQQFGFIVAGHFHPFGRLPPELSDLFFPAARLNFLVSCSPISIHVCLDFFEHITRVRKEFLRASEAQIQKGLLQPIEPVSDGDALEIEHVSVDGLTGKFLVRVIGLHLSAQVFEVLQLRVAQRTLRPSD